MTARQTHRSWLVGVGSGGPGLVFALILAAAPPARGQSMLGSDPYRPYNAQYGDFALPPSGVNNFAAAGNARMRSYSARANEMGQFYDELYGPEPGLGGAYDRSRRLLGPGVPASSADRQYDAYWNRRYVPNPKDREFYRDKQQREAAYFDAMKETDPRKRAEKLRAVEQRRLQAARSLGPQPRRPLTAPRGSGGASPARTSTPAAIGSPALPSPGTPAASRGAGEVAPRAARPATTAPATGPSRLDLGPRPPLPSGRSAGASGSTRERAERPSDTLYRALRPGLDRPLRPRRRAPETRDATAPR